MSKSRSKNSSTAKPNSKKATAAIDETALMGAEASAGTEGFLKEESDSEVALLTATEELEINADAEVLKAEAEVEIEIDDEDAAVEAADALEGAEFEASALDEKNVFEEMIEAAEGNQADDKESAELVALEGSELDGFESAAIEDLEFVEDERLESILEAMLFASDRPISLATLKMTFKGTNIRGEHIRRTLDLLATEYAGGRRGISLEEVPGGYQLRTKLDNMKFLTRTLKVRPFKVSGPALEVLSIVAYKQPVIKSEIDDIRGVESGHLLRALMEKGLVQFEGKSDFPGRPMLYGTSKKFLEIFGLRNLKELPTLSQIDELLPDGIGDEFESEQKPKLADVTDQLSQNIGNSYSDGEEELMKIAETLQDIDVSSEFFEKEKLKQRESRDAEKAANLREAVMVGETIATRDRNWLERYDEALASGTSLAAIQFAKEKSRLENVKNKDAQSTVANADGENSPAAAESTIASVDAPRAEVDLEGAADMKTTEDDDDEASISGELSALSFQATDGDLDEETDEQVSVRFEEEEDISLDQDLNVPYHDEEEPGAEA